ncbi:hypothetical protein EI94DRAFT_1726839 [Lactarius quietus]|nr:hypothetical protein EI94DRAFT_1726839 [Lactarius quietus]
MDTGALSELIKTKVTCLIQEHLKPIVSELAAQHQMLQTHSALLRYNHNVNDYQMGRLENLRDLEQSINFKVAGALAFDPWQHPTMGTNLREPVPADPRLIPRFTPESKTPAERAAESSELIAQAGVSARRLGVPLTLHDFPRDPAIHSGGENEDPMHSAVPLFGLRAPRWRAKEGLPPDVAPGSATYNGVPAPPKGKKGKRLFAKRAQKLDPKWKTFEAATAPRGLRRRNSPAQSTNCLTCWMGLRLQVHPAPVPEQKRARRPLRAVRSQLGLRILRCPLPNPAPPPVLTPIPAPIPAPIPRPTPIPTASSILLSGPTPSPTLEPRIASTSTANLTNSDITQPHNEQIRPATSTAPPPTSTTPPTMQVPLSLKRSRMAAEFEDDEDDNGAGGSSSNPNPAATVVPPQIKQEGEYGMDLERELEPEPQPQRKRRRRSAAPSPSPSIGLVDAAGGGWPGPGQLRRSTRVARAHACATATTAPASRKRQSNGRRATTKS